MGHLLVDSFDWPPRHSPVIGLLRAETVAQLLAEYCRTGVLAVIAPKGLAVSGNRRSDQMPTRLA
jgi:hypothetical protein